jgi:hypothetical protein
MAPPTVEVEDYTSVADMFFTECARRFPTNWRDFLILAKEVTIAEWKNRVIKRDTLRKTPTWKNARCKRA